VEGGHERCALAAGGHVAAAQVGHHVQAGQFSQQGGIEQLDGVAPAVELPRPMADGLAMGADGEDRPRMGRECGPQRLHDLGIAARQRIAGQRGAVQFVVAGGVERQELAPQCLVEGAGGVGEHVERAIRAELRSDPVHAVQRGAGHQADVELAHVTRIGPWLIPPGRTGAVRPVPAGS
jgi:hypothetical protein